MTTYFPLTEALNRDASQILTAIHQRAFEVKQAVDSQSITKRVALVALDLIGLAAAFVTVASLPVAALLMTLSPLSVAATSLTLSISCLSLSIFLHPRSRGEMIVKDHWKQLFQAIRLGNGSEIIRTCQELAKQEKQRSYHFYHCLGISSPENVDPFWKPFLHKTSLVGYVLMAIEDFRSGDENLGNKHIDQALSYYEHSNFPESVHEYLKELKNKQSNQRQLILTHSTAKGLHTLDYFLFQSKK